ncbi:calsequestrin-1-like isoform X1 [Syngnathoides biaculeatus]|uniref:calsequestrin-1-like isoform X1 n=1 Tax=Syngnathoides biaculeatus TaxID=300417 RepID=UPI002ADD4B11|nr:calsequestrin-1-like isoform X1 [Syngnathoides biaculeatus]
MKWACRILGVLLSLGALASCEKGLQIPEYDGRDRVHPLSAKDYKSVMKKYDVMVIYYHKNVHGDRNAIKQFQMEELALELAAQVLDELDDEDIGFGLVDEKEDSAVAQKLGLDEVESVYIFANNEIIEYDGELAADTLVEFIYDVMEEPVEIIDNDRELKGFHNMDEVIKLVGYFKSGKSARRLTRERTARAARNVPFSPDVFCRFHRVRQRRQGVSSLHQILCHLRPQDRQEIKTEDERGGLLRALHGGIRHYSREALHRGRAGGVRRAARQTHSEEAGTSQHEDDIDGEHIVAFAEEDDPDGFEFLEILKEVARENTDNPNLSIIWIDPDCFPLLVPYWEKTFRIDLSSPQIGVVDVEDADSVWMEMDDHDGMPSADELERWIEDVLSGKIDPDDDDDDE